MVGRAYGGRLCWGGAFGVAGIMELHLLVTHHESLMTAFPRMEHEVMMSWHASYSHAVARRTVGMRNVCL